MSSHRRRYPTILASHLDAIDRASVSLRIALLDAETKLTPFSPHYDAVQRLRLEMQRCLNLLNDRPEDHTSVHPLARL